MFKEMDINISDLRIGEDAEGEIKDIFCKHIIDGEEFELMVNHQEKMLFMVNDIWRASMEQIHILERD